MQSAAPAMGRRERNKQKVQERLYDSALGLITERGYDGTSIEDIAERADVARGTFFNYFQRKEDLIVEWGQRRRARLAAGMLEEGAPGQGAVAQLEHCMTVLGVLSESERAVTIAMLTAWVKAGRPVLEEPYVAETFARIVALGVAGGEFQPGVSAEQVGHVLRDLYLGTLYRWCRQGEPGEPGALVAELHAVLRMVIEGIGAR
ncbi:TetR family transcriptional regulator [Kitasatospora sp. MMS16-BH015]|uniref:TetR/AcrR family transcriptional regulator n=1 Tax=Kitasatospora sp. MMS16-BH015 TaxID=2018025 RepID=UPI000CA27AE5|nr:TetR/AcrR family transcriptional regulator [Kitasatospora sp. MMS16-BH015]AUG80609.1 TetR family transcriptional regulator [Kitasatospora sp. MMS16-BH015]